MRLLVIAGLVVLAGCVRPAIPAYDEQPAHAPSAVPVPTASPYAGEEARDIKALSPEEIEGYQKGAGLGYAKPAELNSYPGPLHALEMAERLGLSEEQRDAFEG